MLCRRATRARGRPGGETLHGVAYVLPLLGCHDLHDMCRAGRATCCTSWGCGTTGEP